MHVGRWPEGPAPQGLTLGVAGSFQLIHGILIPSTEPAAPVCLNISQSQSEGNLGNIEEWSWPQAPKSEGLSPDSGCSLSLFDLGQVT